MSLTAAERAHLSAEELALYDTPEVAHTAGQPPSNSAAPEPTPFERRAQILLARNIPVAPIPARTKGARLPNWEQLATTDQTIISQWSKDGYTDGNTAAVAKAQPGGVFFLEIDKPNFHSEIQKQTNKTIPSTFVVSSRPGEGRGHFYFRHTPETIALAQGIGKAYISGKDENGKEAWSLRWNNAYVIGPLSIHPDTGKLYEIVPGYDVELADGPTWLVQWCVDNQGDSNAKKPAQESEKVFKGQRDDWLISKLGEARQRFGADYTALLALGHQLNQAHCVPPLSDKDVEKTARSASKYKVVPPTRVPFEHYGEQAQQKTDAAANASNGVQGTFPDIPKIVYPVFPDWVFTGIAAYDRWVKPFCKVNSRYPEYMMLPLMVLILNYLGTKVRIEFKGFPLSIFLLMVGKKGRVIKSSSAQDAMEFCKRMGILKHSNGTSAEGKSIVFTAGSTEGLGAEMSRTNCKNAVLFYDEFSKLIAKMSIEHSSFADDLSTTYESGKFENHIKGRKENFTHEPNSYCLSLIGCTTDKRYPRLASRLFSAVDGMDERFFVLYQPEVLKDVTPPVYVPIPDDVVDQTKALIFKAISQQTYSIDYPDPLVDISKLGNRIEIRAEKWALAFAILLGKDSIDEICVDRGIAVAKYEHAVKQYLQTGEAISREGALQREIRLVIERAGGSMKLRELQRKVNYDDYGVSLWKQVYRGLLAEGILREIGTGKHGDPTIVKVLVPLLRDEEEES